MNTDDNTLAARFFFRNCSVSLHLPGEIRISRTLTPGPDDIVLDRDFTPAGSPSEFIGQKSDFYRFLDVTSPSNAGLIKKLTAIGYMLCNKLPRGGRRHRAFICVNEENGSYANGKSLFAQAVAKMCNPSHICGRDIRGCFWLDVVNESTNLLLVDDMPSSTNFGPFLTLCTDDWHVIRKGQAPLVIPREKAPYVLMTTSSTAETFPNNGSFNRRFTLLEFASIFGPECPIQEYIGRVMFKDWDSNQWHMFDNFMFYCVLEYLRSYSKGEDVFSFYE